MSHVKLNKSESREIDNDFGLATNLDSNFTNSNFWNGFSKVIDVLDPISKCIGSLEFDSCFIADPYSCFIYICSIIRESKLEENSRNEVTKEILYRWSRICSSVHSL